MAELQFAKAEDEVLDADEVVKAWSNIVLTVRQKFLGLENKISTTTDASDRTRLETELANANKDHNALVQDEQVALAKSQTLERYIEAGKTWVDSLQNQAATQMVLINKLQTDTKQRVVLYDALTKSLKTAQQQDVAHRAARLYRFDEKKYRRLTEAGFDFQV